MKLRTCFACALILALGLSVGVLGQEVQIDKNRKLPPLPDLVIMRATYIEASHAVNVWVMNRSKGSKAKSCTLKLSGLRHKGLQIVEQLELTRTVPALAGGESYMTTFDVPKPEGEIKTALSKVVVDSENVVHELRENNNEWPLQPKDDSARAGDGGRRRLQMPTPAGNLPRNLTTGSRTRACNATEDREKHENLQKNLNEDRKSVV